MPGTVLDLAYAPRGGLLAGACDDGTVRLWDTADPGREPAVLSGHEGSVQVVAFGLEGASLVSGGGDGTVRLWEVAAARQVALLPGWTRDADGRLGAILGVAFSPDGRTVAVADGADRVRLWPAPNAAT